MLPNQTYTPDDVLRIVWRRRWLIVAPAAAAAISAAIITSQLPDRYRSETLILVVPQRVPESYVRSTVTSRIEDRLSTIQQQILSRSRLERIIRDFDLYPEERRKLTMEDVVARMRLDIEGPRIERGDGFRVAYSNSDPRLAQQVTERLASLFIEENLRDREVLAEGTNQFLDAQLEDARQRLIEQEKALERYKREHAGELPTQVESNLQALQSVELRLQSVSETTSREMERRIVIERQIGDLEAAAGAGARSVVIGGPDRSPDSLPAQLDAAAARLRALQQRYKPEHPDVMAERRAIAALQARLAAQSGTPRAGGEAPVPVDTADVARASRLRELRADLKNVEGQIARNQSEERRLRALADTYQAKIDAAPRRESELIELTRDYDTLESAYKSLLAKREESKIAANLERRQIGEQFKVLDPARIPERPDSPKRLQINLLASVGGLLVGLALTALFEYRDRSLRTEEEAARVLQLPVLAVVPLMLSDGDVQTRWWQRMGVTGVLLLIVLAGGYVAWTLERF